MILAGLYPRNLGTSCRLPIYKCIKNKPCPLLKKAGKQKRLIKTSRVSLELSEKKKIVEPSSPLLKRQRKCLKNWPVANNNL